MGFQISELTMTSKKLQLIILVFIIFSTTIFIFAKKVLFNSTIESDNAKKIPARSLEKLRPYPKNQESLDISALAALSIFIRGNGEEYLLFEKNKEIKLPIASITKLMVALVASEMYKENDEIIISENALSVKGVSGNYKPGEKILFKDALHALLVGSHNEIAVAIAEKEDVGKFIEKMNDKAKELGLKDTYYFNVSGVDPYSEGEGINYSTAVDIYKLLRYIFENYPKVFSILREKEYYLKDGRGDLKIAIKNTNKLLEDNDTALPVLGGKTGSTPRAKTNLAIVSETPSKEGYLVNVVMNSEDSFQDMKILLRYAKESFVW